MATYNKTTWVDGGAPGISATNLNNIETGIENANNTANDALPKAGGTMTGIQTFAFGALGQGYQIFRTANGPSAAEPQYQTQISSAGAFRIFGTDGTTPKSLVDFDYINDEVNILAPKLIINNGDLVLNEGRVMLANNQALEGYDTGGTNRFIAYIDASDQLQMGASSLPLHLNSNGESLINGNEIYHSGNITSGTAAPSGGSDGDIYIQY